MNHAQRAKQWILSKEGSALLEHAGRQYCVTSETMDDGTIRYVRCALEDMTLPECIEECRRFREIYSNVIGGPDADTDAGGTDADAERWQYLSDEHLFDASIQQLRSWLKYFYHPDTHSYLLRWIGAIFADTVDIGMQYP